MPYINLAYDVEKDTVKHNSDMDDEQVCNLISEFLQTQIGKGKDDSKPNDFNIYTINLNLDIGNDTFYINDNINNKGLRCGILLRVITLIGDKK